MTILIRLFLVAVPYVALAYLAVTWIACLYAYKDASLAPHAKWGIPALLFFATVTNLRGKKL
jgi:hypothetical protein